MNVKPYISGAIRKSGLLDLVDRLWFNVQKLRHRRANRAFRAAHPSLAIPPDYFIYETYRLNIAEYYNDGLGSAKELAALIGKYRDIHTPGFRLLDWGCGTGRVARHFPALLAADAQVSGSDYNEKYIRWCVRHLPAVKWSANGVQPPLPYADNEMDAVTGLSVFTHLSASNHSLWMDELHRILKPWGILVVSTQGEGFSGKLLPEEKRNFAAGRLVTRESSVEGHRLYSSFQPEPYVRALIQDKFGVLELIKGTAHPSTQDVWVLQKIQ